MSALPRGLISASKDLLARPALLLLGALTLGLGIGANAAIFSVVDHVLLRPLPYAAPERLVKIWESNPEAGFPRDHPSAGNVLDWQRDNETFTAITGWWTNTVTLLEGPFAGEPEEIGRARVATGFFEIFSTAPLHGRLLNDEDITTNAEVVTLSHDFWQRRFRGDPGVVGEVMHFADRSREIVGVLPPGLAPAGREVDVYEPWDFIRSYEHLAEVPRDSRFIEVAGRLRPGTNLRQADADLDRIAARLALDHPKTNRGWSVELAPLLDATVGKTSRTLWLLLGAVALVLLLACANVANLLLVRGLERMPETALRGALGATRGHLMGRVLGEAVLLACCGAVAGLGFAFTLLDLLRRLGPSQIPRLADVTLDGRIFFFGLVVTLLTGLFAGLPAALRGSRPRLAEILRGAGERVGHGRRQTLLRDLLTASETALAMVLLVGALLLAQSFTALLGKDLGFRGEQTLVTRIFLDRSQAGTEAILYFREVSERLAALPGALSAAATTALPMSELGFDFDRPYWPEGPRPDQPDETGIRMVQPGYLGTLGIALHAGRDFTEDDKSDAPYVVIVNRMMASRAWPGLPLDEIVGRRVVLAYRNTVYPSEVVGIAGDTYFRGPRSEPRPEVYLPHAQNAYAGLHVVVHTEKDPQALIPAVRRVLLEIDPKRPAHSVLPLEDLLLDRVARDRFAAFLFALFAVLALALAAVGTFSAVATSVRREHRGIAIRRALGAGDGTELRRIVVRALRPPACGIVVGMFVAASLAPLLNEVLFEVSGHDLRLYGAAAGSLLLVALGACYLPAREALRADPARILGR